MGGPIFHLKNLHYPDLLSSSSTSSSTKMMKTIIQTLFYTQFLRLVRALAKLKSILIHTLKYELYQPKPTKKHRNLIFGSFRLHYNWCSSSSHLIVPVIDPPSPPPPALHDLSGDLSTYLQWLEDRSKTTSSMHMHDHEGIISSSSSGGDTAASDIDRLAEMFIANCHEKFLLEKQESYRRFQEMLARSV